MMFPLSPVCPHYGAVCKFLVICAVPSVPTVPSRFEVYIGEWVLVKGSLLLGLWGKKVGTSGDWGQKQAGVLGMTTKQTVSRARAGYQKANEEAARIILASEARYGGPDSLMVQWARVVIEKAAPKDAECGPLFEAADGRRAA